MMYNITTKKAIEEIDSDNNVINEFDSIRECSRQTNINRVCISDVLHGRINLTHGRRFRFKQNE